MKNLKSIVKATCVLVYLGALYLANEPIILIFFSLLAYLFFKALVVNKKRTGKFFSNHASGADVGTGSSPSVNVDGTPMIGRFDLNGNPYGTGSFESNSHEPMRHWDHH